MRKLIAAGLFGATLAPGGYVHAETKGTERTGSPAPQGEAANDTDNPQGR